MSGAKAGWGRRYLDRAAEQARGCRLEPGLQLVGGVEAVAGGTEPGLVQRSASHFGNVRSGAEGALHRTAGNIPLQVVLSHLTCCAGHNHHIFVKKCSNPGVFSGGQIKLLWGVEGVRGGVSLGDVGKREGMPSHAHHFKLKIESNTNSGSMQLHSYVSRLAPFTIRLIFVLLPPGGQRFWQNLKPRAALLPYGTVSA
jgi:hypothetical protein